MTSPEHFVFGLDIAIVLGLHKFRDWKLPAIAAIAAVLPDWDGLMIFGGFSLLEKAHRVWGHGLISVAIMAILLGSLDYRFDIIGRTARFFGRFVKDIDVTKIELRNEFRACGLFAWIGACFLGGLTHLFGDIIVSGNSQYAPWPVLLFWPFSDREFVWPIFSWGDFVPSIILFTGAIAMLRRKNHIRSIALFTLFALTGYAVLIMYFRTSLMF